MELMKYDEMINNLSHKNRTINLLLGNGFSVAYNPHIFSYNALSQYIESIDNKLLLKLFDIIKTKNFEMVMQQLDNFCEIAKTFGTDIELIKTVEVASNSFKTGLIDAIKELHPEHVFTIPDEQSDACSRFLQRYLGDGSNVFTTNYDILLYWVLMRNNMKNAIDGFGRDVENYDDDVPKEDLIFSELRWGKHKDRQNVHYLHGALPIFDSGVDIVKEEYDEHNYLLEKIKRNIDRNQYPVFVTAGNGNEKMVHIMHNHYLSYCYDKLCSITGSLITFGFNFGEYDDHIIDAINIAAMHGKKAKDKLHSVYIGIYSEEDYKHILSIEGKFECKVNKYDARTASVWGKN